MGYKTFLKIITYGPFIVIPLFVFTLIISSYKIYSMSFESSVKNLKTELLQSEKQAVETKVNSLSNLIVYQKSRIKNELLSRVKERVQTAYDISQNIYDTYKDTKSPQEIKDIITTTLQTFSWEKGESYIWAMDYSGVHYLLENKKLRPGTSFIDFQDATGRYIVQEEVAICKDKGEGYLWDTFTKPEENNNKQYKQVAFVKTFKPYNLCLGSAEFLDTATKKTNKFLFNIISQVDKIGNHYVAILNSQGALLVHSKLPQFVGENVKITDKRTLDAIKGILHSIKDKESSSYVYDWFNPLANQVEKKYAYVKRVPNTNWIITSGFFLSEIQNKLAKEKIHMTEVYTDNTKYIVIFSVLIIFASLILSYFLSRKIRKYFKSYEQSIKNKNTELQNLNASLEEKVQTRTFELKKIKDNFEKLATTDTLTQLHNRYSIMKILSKEMHRSKRYTAPLSMIMYDIDHFKSVNDTYGHDKGDEILASLSSLAQDAIREADYIGRYGGEEFLIVMPSTPLKDATIFAERLRELVQEHNFEGVDDLTISIGVVQLEDEDLESFFKRVDELLYTSKNKGRNRVSS